MTQCRHYQGNDRCNGSIIFNSWTDERDNCGLCDKCGRYNNSIKEETKEKVSVYSPGEKEELIRLVEKQITNCPITFEEIMNLITLCSSLKLYGYRPEVHLELMLDTLRIKSKENLNAF